MGATKRIPTRDHGDDGHISVHYEDPKMDGSEAVVLTKYNRRDNIVSRIMLSRAEAVLLRDLLPKGE